MFELPWPFVLLALLAYTKSFALARPPRKTGISAIYNARRSSLRMTRFSLTRFYKPFFLYTSLET